MKQDERDNLLRQVAITQERHGHLMNQVLWQIEGNEMPKVEGLIPAQKRIEDKFDKLSIEVTGLQQWRKTRGSFTYKGVIAAFGWLIGILGTIGGLISVYVTLFAKH